MSRIDKLPRSGGEFLLRLAEAIRPVVLGQILNEMSPDIAQKLRTSGALIVDGKATSIPVDDEVGKQFAELHWDEARRAYGYFHSADGFAEAAADDQIFLRMDMQWWLNWLAQSLDLTNSSRPTEIINGIAWDIGDLWITRQRKVPVMFARRLFDVEILRSLEFAINGRAGRSGGLILTSTQFPGITSLTSFAVSPIAGLLTNDAEGFVIDRGLALSPFITPPTGAANLRPLQLSPDGRLLVINGINKIDFKSHKHIAIIRKLVAGFEKGKRFRAAELLDEADSEVASLQRAFGAKKWAALKPYLKSRTGLWGFEV